MDFKVAGTTNGITALQMDIKIQGITREIMKFDVRYYLVAILFILFDLEIAFLFPWAVVLPDIGFFGYAAIAIPSMTM